jgi:hypothetical protein
MAPEFKMAAKNCFWSGVHKYAFFSKRFFLLTFPLSIAEFFWFFFNPKWRLALRWRFCHFKITLFSKNPLQAMTNTKTKILMDLQKIYILKKNNQLVIQVQVQVNKFNKAPKIKMAANLEFLLKFYFYSMVYA